ncbi:hypothetical protein LTR91_026725, partial [Friedmanniomyces endolithicus]
MTTRATNIISKLLANSTNLELVKELVAEDATHISLNYNDPELRGTIEKFDMHASFGGSNTADASDKAKHVAIFGRFVDRSNSIGKLTDSRFAVWAKVDVAMGKVTSMQFMEDTLSSANGFRSR